MHPREVREASLAMEPVHPGLAPVATPHGSSPQTIRLRRADYDEIGGERKLISAVDLASNANDLTTNAVAMIPDFHDCWHNEAEKTLFTWGSWEIPVPRQDPFWTTTSAALPNSPRLQYLRQQTGGLAPFLLAAFGTFPTTSACCQAVSEHLHCFLVWDSWLKSFGTVDEADQLSSFFRTLGCNTAPPVASDFPQRLARKYPLKVDVFRRTFHILIEGSSATGWSEQYRGICALYAKVSCGSFIPLLVLKEDYPGYPCTS